MIIIVVIIITLSGGNIVEGSQMILYKFPLPWHAVPSSLDSPMHACTHDLKEGA